MRSVALFVLFIVVRQVSGDRIEVAKSCVGNTLELKCEEGEIIDIREILLGDSDCYSSNCCPKSNDCKKSVSYEHKASVHNLCNNKQRCQFNVEKRKIYCSVLGPNNDYEIVNYRCFQDPSITPNTTVQPTPKKDDSTPESPLEPPTPTDFLSDLPSSSRISEPPQLEEETAVDEDHKARDYQEDPSNPQPLRDEPANTKNSGPQNSHHVNFESIVVSVIAGVIAVTLIIAVACLVSRRYLDFKLKYLRQKIVALQERHVNDLYLQPISFQALARTCSEEPACHDTSSCCGNGFDTYDAIKDVCQSLDDGYLKPAEVLGHSSQRKAEEEDRYVLA